MSMEGRRFEGRLDCIQCIRVLGFTMIALYHIGFGRHYCKSVAFNASVQLFYVITGFLTMYTTRHDDRRTFVRRRRPLDCINLPVLGFTCRPVPSALASIISPSVASIRYSILGIFNKVHLYHTAFGTFVRVRSSHFPSLLVPPVTRFSTL